MIGSRDVHKGSIGVLTIYLGLIRFFLKSDSLTHAENLSSKAAITKKYVKPKLTHFELSERKAELGVIELEIDI